jgi:hypothetical protein
MASGQKRKRDACDTSVRDVSSLAGMYECNTANLIVERREIYMDAVAPNMCT